MKIYRWNFQLLLPACILLLGCGQNSTDKTGDVPVIEIVQNLGKYQAVPLSQFATELEYIPLETNENCLLSVGERLIVTSTHIFVWDGRVCCAFGRDGRFLNNIGSVGQGPGEYSRLIDFSMDEKNQSLYLQTLRSLLEYSWDGVFRRSIPLPEEEIYGTPPSGIFFVRDNLFIGHYRNHSGNLLHNFVLFDQASKVVKLFDNYRQFNLRFVTTSATSHCMKPYKIAGHVYVKEISNDTLFYLNEQNELVPHFIFDLGKHSITKEKQENERRVIGIYNANEEIRVPGWPMVGARNYLFFNFSAFNLSGQYSFPKARDIPYTSDQHGLVGVYDKSNQTTQLLDTDPVSRMPGLINDLDGGLSFWPRYISDNEVVDIWRAEEMKEYLTEAYFAAHEIKNPEAHQKLKELLENMTEYDNPVIVIAKLKPDL